jgi:hypothetical protein
VRTIETTFTWNDNPDVKVTYQREEYYVVVEVGVGAGWGFGGICIGPDKHIPVLTDWGNSPDPG